MILKGVWCVVLTFKFTQEFSADDIKNQEIYCEIHCLAAGMISTLRIKMKKFLLKVLIPVVLNVKSLSTLNGINDILIYQFMSTVKPV